MSGSSPLHPPLPAAKQLLSPTENQAAADRATCAAGTAGQSSQQSYTALSGYLGTPECWAGPLVAPLSALGGDSLVAQSLQHDSSAHQHHRSASASTSCSSPMSWSHPGHPGGSGEVRCGVGWVKLGVAAYHWPLADLCGRGELGPAGGGGARAGGGADSVLSCAVPRGVKCSS